MAVFKLNNRIQKYAWGSVSAMRDLLGYQNEDNEPMAELWMGAHPKSPSEIIHGETRTTALNEYIAQSPDAVLGAEVSKRFGGRLPFLFKVLAAGSPLSIQAHPNLEQASAGFARENDAGIAPDAFNRNYKDDNHKPEIICALTEYHAMRGFRSAGVIAANFRKIMIPGLEAAVTALEAAAASPAGGTAGSVDAGVSAALKTFFTELMQLKDEPKAELIKKAMESGLEQRWISRFAELYPGDIGIVSPLYLNVVTLKPGEAMYLPAGELHAYLEGLGMELMANSDNVLRGGLTPKHVDVRELLSTLNFESCKPEILTPERLNDNESAYPAPAPEFFLSRIEFDGEYSLPEESYGPEHPSIFICLEGSVDIIDKSGTGDSFSGVKLGRGDTAFAGYASRLILKGRCILYRASVPA